MNTEPQIALVGAESWVLLGPSFSQTGLIRLWPLPDVSCPVLDTSSLDPDVLQRILHSSHSPEGITNVDALITTLLRPGAHLLTPLPITLEQTVPAHWR